jgi:hypothetical protein
MTWNFAMACAAGLLWMVADPRSSSPATVRDIAVAFSLLVGFCAPVGRLKTLSDSAK